MSLNPKIEAWDGKVVWLIGSSSGIGRATASRLHAAGARVIVSARGQEALDSFTAQHPGSHAITLDATDSAAVHRAAARVVREHGGLDLALYCAGTYEPMRATDFKLDVMQKHLKVNVGGALVMIDAVLPQLKAQAKAGRGGHISLVSSVAGFRGLPQSLAYGPTKAALINLAETMYLDLSPIGLGISVITPGFVETPLTAQNDFKMPALIKPEEAAREIVDGWQRGAFEIDFPKRFTWFLKLMRMVPYALYFPLIRKTTGL
ncbi:MAG: SDR family NAD(P)-dependent oxidoreductase [Pseudomonadota bacterium]|nr:SDR family NAD(P)-dependent oxidoreductase [Pseudomonadota bacterium]